MAVQETAPQPDANPLDLEAYLQRIGYAGPRAADLDTLRGLIFQHVTSIPFENLNPLAGWPVRLDLPSIQEKLVRQSRGGYCFEQNTLFEAVLRTLGYEVSCLASRVVWNQPEDAPSPRSHKLLRVELDGASYLVDVGFGVAVPTCPLLLQPDLAQQTPHEPFRLVPREHGYLLLQALAGTEWRPLYRFTLDPAVPADYEVSNWYTSTHPSSPFVQNLLAARADPDRRNTLINGQLNTYWLDGRKEQQALTSLEELKDVLREVFHVNLPKAPELDHALERVLAIG